LLCARWPGDVPRFVLCVRRAPAPRSSLAPYTTLFRSGPGASVPGGAGVAARLVRRLALRPGTGRGRPGRVLVLGRLRGGVQRARSEEHTSELQSRETRVCRLLLEKKRPRDTHQPTWAT